MFNKSFFSLALGTLALLLVAGVASATPLAITAVTPPVGYVGSSYPATTLKATGGSGTGYTWSVATGSSLPAGLTLSAAGVLRGKPTTAGSITTSIKVTDSAKSTATGSLSFTVKPGLAISPAALPFATIGKAYSQTLKATGGSGTGYTWKAVVPNPLSTFGLSFSAAGVVSGIPMTSGTASFTAVLTDSASNSVQAAITIPIYAVLTLTPAMTLPSATAGLSYSASISASGGSGKYTFTLTGMPANGLTASPSGATVAIKGTPTAAATVTFTASVKDAGTGAAVGPNTYTIPVYNPLTLPSPNPSTLPAATVGQKYTGSIVAAGGAGPTYTWSVNGLGISQPGLSVTLSNGLSATTTNNNTLTITGTPTAATAAGKPLSFTALVTDSARHTAGPATYTIAIGQATGQIAGRIQLANGCGNRYALPPMKVTINTIPAQIATTDSNGNFSFPSVPNGTWTVTPSITGPSSLFTPASIGNVVVNGNSRSGLNFTAILGYTVSGNVTYSGTRTGPIYVSLNQQECGNASFGVSIPAPGPFTVRGVMPAKYSLQAWMDTVGFGGPNNSDPGGFIQNLQIPSGGLTGKTVSISDPPSYSITAAPRLDAISPTDSGVAISFEPIAGPNPNNVTVELPTSYIVQWSTDPKFLNPAPSSHTFKAGGTNGTNVWFLYNGMAGTPAGLNNGATYYFRVAGALGSARGPWGVYGGATPIGVKIGAPTAGYAVSGAVTFSSTPSGPLFVGLFDTSAGRGYAARIINPHSPQVFSVHVPAGSNYFFFAWLDQDQDGMIDPGDISNTHDNGANSVPVSGNLQNKNLTLPMANSMVGVQTDRWTRATPSGSGLATNSGVSVSLVVGPANKLPVSATLASGPHTIAPVDMGQCLNCRGQQFQTSPLISTAPALGDSYSFNIKYSDGTTETLTGKVTSVLPTTALPDLVSPNGTANSKHPAFDWDYPSSNAGNYSYSFWVCCNQNGTIWSIPGQNSNARAFSNSQVTPPLQWGSDPTDSTNKPSDSGLNPGEYYTWSVQSQDQYGNTATSQEDFAIQAAPLSLPSPNPASLPSAVVGAPYNGSIAVSGGMSPYTWTVTGMPNDGLNWGWGNSCACINITGTPNSVTTPGNPINFQVTVKDGNGQTYGPIHYTIVVNSKTPVSLPSPTGNPLGSAMVGMPYSASLNAAGGAGGGNYKFTVNGTAIPITNVPVTFANGVGLQAGNSGGNTLFFSGTPNTAGTLSLTIKVINAKDSTDTATQTYSLPVTAGPNGAGNSRLNGTYVCLVRGFNDQDGSRWASVATMVANGSGALTSGVWDTTGTGNPTAMAGTLTGTYQIGTDNNGLAKITAVQTSGGSGTHVSTFAVALSGATIPASMFRMVEADDVGASPSGQTGTADCYQAAPGAFTAATVHGHSFAFGIQGENGNRIPKAFAGRMSAASGAISNGFMDGMRLDQSGNNGGSFTGTYSAPNAATGRFTFSVGSSTFAVYIIDANRMFLLQTAGDSGVMAGEMRTQWNPSAYSASGLKGNAVLYAQAWQFNHSSNAVSGNNSMLFRVNANGAGLVSVNASYDNDNGSFQVNHEKGQSVPIAFDSSHPGRATFSPGSDSAFLYFFNTNQAFFLTLNGSDGFLQTGWLEPQTQTVFTNAAVAGSYVVGQMPLLNADADGNAGVVSLNSTGGLSGGISTAGRGYFQYDAPLSLGYSWDSTNAGTGSMLLSSPKPGGSSSGCIVVTATRSVCALSDSGSNVLVLQK